MIFALLLLSVFTFFLYTTHKLTMQKLIIVILIAGFILRFGYMLYTPFYVRGHDVYNLNGTGHLAYINILYQNMKLPQTNDGQFYHPPLSHFLSALCVRLYALLFPNQSTYDIFEAAKLVPCFASCASLIVFLRILEEFKFNINAKVISMAVIAFHPTFFILSASINNDMLMIFFVATAFLYTVRWYHCPTGKNIIITAVSIGCAMSTKASGAVIAPFTAFVFLLMAIKKYRTPFFRSLAGQFAAFAAVCLPLGLWYYIRNYLLFGQPLGYVLAIDVNSRLYTGNHTIAQRFLTFSLSNLFSQPYCNPFGDYQIWDYTVKCSMFGEFTFNNVSENLARFLILINLALILFSLIAMVYIVCTHYKKDRLLVFSFLVLWFLMMASFIGFNLKYPYGCTMDFRYIVPTVLSGAAFLGLFYSESCKRHNLFNKVMGKCNIALILLFSSVSTLFYLL